jgi:hypothetical protein
MGKTLLFQAREYSRTLTRRLKKRTLRPALAFLDHEIDVHTVAVVTT